MNTIAFSREIPHLRDYDVIVAGGGVAGCAAAYTAARRGCSVLLLEKSNLLGGLATIGQINYFVPMCNGHGKQIIFGLAEKWLRDSARLGYNTIPAPWRNGEPDHEVNERYCQTYPPYIFALQLLEDVSGAGVDLLYDCVAVEAVRDGNRFCGVVTDSKSGLAYYGCRVLIDTTGDGDLFRRAGVPCAAGENYFTYIAKMITLESCKKAVERGSIAHATTGITGGGINLFGDRQPADVPRWSGLTVEEVTDYLIRNQRLVLDKLKQSDPETRDLVMPPFMPQFRTTCHLVGDYALRVEDAYRHFDDSICAINDFEHRNHLFEIPLRAICRRDFPNLLTAGRSASGVGYGWDLIRVIPPAILTGQAAGEAAVQSLREGVGVADVNIGRLQDTLAAEHVMIHFPDAYIPEDRTVIIHGAAQSSHPEGHIE